MNDSVSYDLEEFVCFDMNSTELQSEQKADSEQNNHWTDTEQYTHWTDSTTMALIHSYKEHYKKVGKAIKTQKKLYEIIAAVLNEKYGLNLTGSTVSNKWKTLERSYKKIVDNNNKTGRGKKYFKYEKEMDDIFQKQKKINPEILLAEDTVQLTANLQHKTIPEKENTNSNNNDEEKIKGKPSRSSIRKKNRTDVLEQIRQDRLKYNKEQLALKRERLELEKEKLNEQKRRNNLMAERNHLMKEYLNKV